MGGAGGIPHVVLSDSWQIDRLLGWSLGELEENRAFIRGCIARGDVRSKQNGKYAFIRVLHMQEPVSVLFSLLSFVSSVEYLWHVRRTLLPGNKAGQRLGAYGCIVRGNIAINAVCWLFSALFHVRDCWTTQCMDYTMTVGGILSLLHLSFVRVFARRKSGRTMAGIAVPFALFFTIHSYYLVFVNFDFAYNSAACGVLALLCYVQWFLWLRSIRGRMHGRLLVVFCFGLGVCLFFHLLDFGPLLFVLDSHALWHVMHFVFSRALYGFVVEDLRALAAEQENAPVQAQKACR